MSGGNTSPEVMLGDITRSRSDQYNQSLGQREVGWGVWIFSSPPLRQGVGWGGGGGSHSDFWSRKMA